MVIFFNHWFGNVVNKIVYALNLQNSELADGRYSICSYTCIPLGFTSLVI